MSNGVSQQLFGDYGSRSLIRLTGADAAKYLHNFCAQDILRLPEGGASEAFITSVQGKTLGYVRVFRTADQILLETSADQAAGLLAHFDKYLIRERVEFTDLSSHAHAYIASPELIRGYLEKQGITLPSAPKPFALIGGDRAGAILTPWEAIAADLGYVVLFGDEAASPWLAFVESQGAVRLSAEEIEARRIAFGAVEFGVDVTADNLPQEVARDAEAISFNKGCYLGQETVARIDALGHVNRFLVRLRGEGKLAVAAGASLSVDGKEVGKVTSAAYLASENVTVALGYVRRGRHAAGTEVVAGDAALRIVG
jgi:folate-binding protein YgfZ